MENRVGSHRSCMYIHTHIPTYIHISPAADSLAHSTIAVTSTRAIAMKTNGPRVLAGSLFSLFFLRGSETMDRQAILSETEIRRLDPDPVFLLRGRSVLFFSSPCPCPSSVSVLVLLGFLEVDVSSA